MTEPKDIETEETTETQLALVPETQLATVPTDVEVIEAPNKAPAAASEVWHAALDNEPHLWSSTLQYHLLDAPTFFKPGFAGLDAVTYPLLLQETEAEFRYAEGEAVQRLGRTPEDLATSAAIAAGAIACPMCGSKGEAGQIQRVVIGKQTGVRVKMASPCYCLVYHRYGRQWMNAANVSLLHRDCTWDNFVNPANPLRKRFRLKDDAFKLIKTVILAHPGYNMLLCGPGGSGKTSLMTALYDRALRNWAKDSFDRGSSDPAVWKSSASTLMSEHIEWIKPRGKDDNEEVKRPTVMEEKVLVALKERNGFTPHVSISEFDKYKMTAEFQTNVLHKILNVVWANKGQVVCDSNIGMNALLKNLTPQYGPPMIRRLIGTPHGIYIDFWSGKVYVNGVRQKLGYNGELVPQKEELDLGIPDNDPSETFKPQTFHSKQETANNQSWKPATTGPKPSNPSSGSSRPRLPAPTHVKVGFKKRENTRDMP